MSSDVALASIPRRVVAYAIDVVMVFAGVVALQASSPSPGFRMGFVVVYALLFLYLAVTLRTPQRQGPHDRAAGTIVNRESRGVPGDTYDARKQ